MNSRVVCAVCAFIVVVTSSAALAHSRSQSYSFWSLTENGAQVRAQISPLELTRAGLFADAPDYRQRVSEMLTNNLQLEDDDGRCQASSTLPPVVRDGGVTHSWRLHCASRPRAITSKLGEALSTEHSHFLTVYTGQAAPITKVLTTQDNGFLNLPTGSKTTLQHARENAGFVDFAALGLRHILSGWDHLIFLLALVALATSLREVAWLATGFTLGHSLTLALAVLGLANPAPLVIEALIALSIVGLALENGWRLDSRSRWLALCSLPVLLLLGAIAGALPALVIAGLALFIVCYLGLLRSSGATFRLRLALTAGFGLFHGFGFAGVLTVMHLAPGKTVEALLGFNLGVEVGQLLLLALVWPLLYGLRRLRVPTAEAVTLAAAAVGVAAYIFRLFA